MELFKKIFSKKEEEKKRFPEQSNFCYYPFFQVLLSADGKYMPCSHHTGFMQHNGKELRVGEYNIEEAWQSEYMQDLRKKMLNNERHPGCVQCWKEQDLGLKPMRYDSYGYHVPELQVQHPVSPLRVEINASNVCNLKCRICWSHASTKWIKEAKDLYQADGELHFNLTPENLSIIQSWVPHFTQIGFFGGEPLMSEENILLMEYCVKSGHSQHISLLINTNTTFYSDKLIALFQAFQNVYLNFSIDDIGARFEYQRSGAKWTQVVENLHRYVQYGGYTGTEKIQCKICCSVTLMNIYYFPEFFDFFNENFPGLPVFWNLVYMPEELSIALLPEETKQQIANRLKKYVKTTYQMDELRTKTIDSLIAFLKGKTEKDFSEFFRYIARHDLYRKESFKTVFSEFYTLIKPYQPEDLSMP